MNSGRGKVMDKLSDSWQTPQALFDEINKEFNFNIDLCATEENSKCILFMHDYLNNKLYLKNTNKIVSCKFYLDNIDENGFDSAFMNPPYSNPLPFIEKAWEDSKHCKIVALVKCDPSTKWWATFWNYTDICSDNKFCVACNGSGRREDFIGKGNNCDQCSGEGSRILKTASRGSKPGCEVRFFPKRIKFDPPAGWEGKTSGPTFSSALIIMDRRGER
jgi:phage N-6-adenine-methyltransferase